MPPELASLALGLGCDRGTPASTLIAAIEAALARLSPACTPAAVNANAVASIDLKADEAGLLAAAAHFGWRLTFYPAARLATMPVPNPSATVLRYTGTPSVAEAAALLAAGGGTATLLLEKHKQRGADGRNATVSIARCLPRPC